MGCTLFVFLIRFVSMCKRRDEFLECMAHYHIGGGSVSSSGACGIKTVLCGDCRFYGDFDPSEDRILCTTGERLYEAFKAGFSACLSYARGVSRRSAEDALSVAVSSGVVKTMCSGEGYNQRRGFEACRHRDECSYYARYVSHIGHRDARLLVRYKRIIEFRRCDLWEGSK